MLHRTMNLRVLGCAGGIGGRERFTTCLWLDHDILLDAGTGITSLNLEQLAVIDHVFLTHCHLDHVAGLALLVDAVQGRRAGPVTVHATQEVIASLKQSLFNWALWPDFSTIPTKENPGLRWSAFVPGTAIDLGGRLITPYPVNHTPGSVGYWVHNTQSGFLFTGDMCSTPELWATLANEDKLRLVIVDCSFPDADAGLAARSMHFSPRALVDEIQSMPQSIEFLIYHLKPGQEDLLMQELAADGAGRVFKAVKCGDHFVF